MRRWAWVLVVCLLELWRWGNTPAWGAPTPLVYWPMNEVSGTTMPTIDSATAAMNGQLCEGVTCPQQGPTWVAGMLGNALSFDGTTDRVQIPATPALNNLAVKTVAGWVRIPTYSGTGDLQVASKNTCGNGWYVFINATSHTLTYDHCYAGSFFPRWQAPTNAILANTWTHVAVVFDRTNSANDPLLYINGILQTATLIGTKGGTAGDDSSALVELGRCNGCTGLAGQLDDVRVYAVALSPAEIRVLANTTPQLTFAWNAATDDVAVTGYRVYYRIAPAAYTLPNSVDMGNVLTGMVPGLTANTLYYFCVTAHDGAAVPNESVCSQETGNFTGPTTPTAPTELRDAGHTCRQVRLRWLAAQDDLGVTQYRARRDDVQIGTTTGATLFYDDVTALPNTTYTYHVRAADAAANESSNSNAVVMTTPACP